MIITFIGHSSLYDGMNLSEKIRDVILTNANAQEKLLFYCGGYGDFDNICAKVCRSIRDEKVDSEVIFVTPYITEVQQKKIKYLLDGNLYDSTIYPPLENVLPRFAISKRNEWMIDVADLVIAYVKFSYGGAYKSLEYARKKQKHVINLAE